MSSTVVGLAYLHKHGAAAAGVLATAMGCESRSVSKLLTPALRAGLVVYEGAARRRQYRLAPGYAGHSMRALRGALQRLSSNRPAEGAGNNRGSSRPGVSLDNSAAGARTVAPQRLAFLRALGGRDDPYFCAMLLGTMAAAPDEAHGVHAIARRRRARAAKAAAMNRRRGDQTRQAVLAILDQGETTPDAIGEALGITQEAAAQVLRKMLGAGVERRKVGKMYWYRRAG